MGVLKELKELVKEMGGNASQAQTIGQAVDKIPASGGGGLSARTTVLNIENTFQDVINAIQRNDILVLIAPNSDEASYDVPFYNYEVLNGSVQFSKIVILQDEDEGKDFMHRKTWTIGPNTTWDYSEYIYEVTARMA